MTRLIGAELFKLRTTRLYLGLLAGAVALVVLVTSIQLLVGEDPTVSIEGASSVIETPEDLRSVLNVASVASLFTLVLGATAVASEHRHRTIASTYLVTPHRSRVIVAKVLSYTVAGILFGVIVEGAALATASTWLVLEGSAVPFGAPVTEILVAAPIVTGLAAGMGVGISAAIPNQLGAVLVAIGWAMIVEQLISGLLPAVAPWLPFAGVSTAISGQNPELGTVAGVTLGVGYLALVAGAGIQVVRTRDVA